MNDYPITKNFRDRVMIKDGMVSIKPVKRFTTESESISVAEFQRQVNERARAYERTQEYLK